MKANLFEKKGLKNIEPAKWTSKYNNITFHAEEKTDVYMPIGGMNSEGLVIAELYVNDDNTTNISFKNTKQALMCSRWVGYVLPNGTIIKRINANVKKETVKT